MEKKRLFNPTGDDNNIRIINGNTTNLLNLETSKYKWAIKLYESMFTKVWIPYKVDMLPDKETWFSLTKAEQEAYKDIISFLVFLDSVQTNNIPNIADYITAPEVVICLAFQTYEESNHSLSYGHILSSLFSHKEATEIVYRWRDNKLLLERNKFIASIYQDFIDNPCEATFMKSIIGNYILEGLYFYNGFQFFHNLNSRGLMSSTDTQIRYIRQEEELHIVLFRNIFLEIWNEYPELKEEYTDVIYDLFRQATEWEIKFSVSILGDKVLGQSSESVTQYAKYRCDWLLKQIEFNPIYNETTNPYKHLDLQSGVIDETTSRTNNFEVTSINYKQPTILDGWSDL